MADDDILDTEDQYQYSIMSETTDEDDFIKVCEVEGDEDSILELPKEEDGTVLLSTVQGQFPNAVGLKYRSSSGGWRGVRIVNGVLKPPQGGWGDVKYSATLKKNVVEKPKDRTKESGEEREDRSRHEEDYVDKEGAYLEDLFIQKIHPDVNDEDLRDYFTKACGELTLAEVKYDRHTGKSRGFGFLRFKTIDAAKEAVHGEHELNGQKVYIRVKKEKPCQLFVGRIPESTTKSELVEYFSTYGEVVDAYIALPFRGFGFITYTSTDIAKSILNLKHEIKGSRLNVAVAEAKEDKERRRAAQEQLNERREYRRRSRSPRRDHRDRLRHERRYEPRRARRHSPPPVRKNEVINEISNMLLNAIGQQQRRR